MASPRDRGPWRLTAASVAALLIAVPALFLLSRDEPAAGSNQPKVLLTPVISRDQGCTNFATYWIDESGLAVEPAWIEGVSNCRRAADGSWIVPTGPGDPRLLAAAPIPEDERERVEAVEAALRTEIAAMEATLSGSIRRDMRGIYSPTALPVTGNVRDRVAIGRARSRYGRVVQAYLIAPEHKLLADYVGWVMERRRGAYGALRAACESDPATAYLVGPCRGLEDALSIRYPPWPWELRNALTLQEYLAQRVSSGQITADAELAGGVESSDGSR